MTARFARLVLALLPALPGCGASLLVIHRPFELQTTDGYAQPLVIGYRIPDGFLQDDREPISNAVFGLLAEPFDWLASTYVAIGCLFDDEESVAYGPLGWLAALTPFATLVPRLEFPPVLTARLDRFAARRLVQGDAAARAAAARELFDDDRICSCDPR